MANSFESRSQYLSLALNARGAMDSLRRIDADGRIEDQFKSSLQQFLSLLLLERGVEGVKHLQAFTGISSFEEVSALEEVLPYFPHEPLAKAFQSVLSDTDFETKKREARVIVSFLGAVEGRALQRYSEALLPQTF